MIYIALFFLLMGCDRHQPKASSSSAAEQLAPVYQERLKAYSGEVPSGSNGWPSTTDCDGTVWAGTACLGGIGVSITDAEYPALGQIQRRPQSTGTCWVEGDSKSPSASTASRDDAVLYMACAFARSDRGALERFQEYVHGNGDYLGQPKNPDLTLMTPTLNAILARAIDKLGGQGGKPGVIIESPGVKDYQDHIELEEILLSTAANGGAANGWEIGLLDSLEAQYPHDALFQAAKGLYSGDCTTAAEMLLGPGVEIPSYVRPVLPQYADAWWLRTAKLVMGHCN